MSDRERWIVYPLLFYALTMGFKANYSEPLEFRCQSIACRTLEVKENIQANALNVQKINNSQTLAQIPGLRAAQWLVIPANAPVPANAVKSPPAPATVTNPEAAVRPVTHPEGPHPVSPDRKATEADAPSAGSPGDEPPNDPTPASSADAVLGPPAADPE